MAHPLHMAQRLRADAVKMFQKCIEMEPKQAVYHLNLAIAFRAQEKYELAIAEYTEAATLDPKLKEAWWDMALCYQAIGKDDAERTDEDRRAAALSDRLLEELEAADVVVIGSPMYNFSVTSGLKAWFDLVSRPGRTFRYTANGVEGMLSGKTVVALTGRGGF